MYRSDSWKNDWKADAETLSAAPRWSMGGKSGLHTPEKVPGRARSCESEDSEHGAGPAFGHSVGFSGYMRKSS